MAAGSRRSPAPASAIRQRRPEGATVASRTARGSTTPEDGEEGSPAGARRQTLSGVTFDAACWTTPRSSARPWRVARDAHPSGCLSLVANGHGEAAPAHGRVAELRTRMGDLLTG